MTIERSLPHAERVLVLAPHPDDEALGCGGAIALYASRGAEICLAVITDGGKISGDLAMEESRVIEARKAETREAARILGIGAVEFFGFPDGEAKSFGTDILKRIEEVVAAFRPDIVFSPSPVDYHDDHLALATAVIKLWERRPGLKTAFYEVYETIRFNTLVDISSVAGVKEEAIMAYHHSLLREPQLFAGAIAGHNRFRSFFTREQGKLYEAFWIVSAPLSHPEIIHWLTYGFLEQDPAVLFLSQLKAVDGMLFELRKCRSELDARNGELAESGKNIETLNREKTVLEQQLHAMSNSVAWRIVRGYYRLRDRMLPENSGMRRLYEKIVSRFKQ